MINSLITSPIKHDIELCNDDKPVLVADGDINCTSQGLTCDEEHGYCVMGQGGVEECSCSNGYELSGNETCIGKARSYHI